MVEVKEQIGTWKWPYPIIPIASRAEERP
jgi:hypothetical protein